MNNIETMKLALEALDGTEALLQSMGLTHLFVYGEVDKAITAIREVLAQSEQAQQAEPVAWIYEDELPEGYPYDAMFEKSCVIDGVRMFPVNVAPPRQPLTDEEISRIWGSYLSRGLEFARAIEAAHGIKEKNT